jgi:preprotein translocase subunit SecE
VSDERDSADASGDGIDDASGGNTALATGTVAPQRPTGKRTRQRALESDNEVTESGAVELGGGSDNGNGTKPKKVKKAPDGPSRNPILYIVNYLKQVVAELRKVIWPNRKQMVSYTTVVLVFLAFMVALIGGVDLGLARLVLLVFG